MPFKPSKWVIYAPVAVLPFLASVVLDGKSFENDLASRVAAGLASAGAGWAKTEIHGRDVILSGDAPSAAQMDAAVAAVAGTYGVRRLETVARVVEPPPPAPQVNPVTGQARGLTVTGTWPEGNDNALTAGIAGKAYVLGKDANLTSDGKGNWTLALPGPLKPGTYDVTATVTSKSGLTSSDAGKDELTVAEPPELKPPTVNGLESREPAPVLGGTWDPAAATALAVTVGPKVYRLGTDAALSAEGRNWSLKLPQPLADGAYDVTAEVGDELGRIARSAAPGKLVIDSTPPAAPAITSVISLTPLSVAGTMPADAATLLVRLAGRTWTLGKDAGLKSDGGGNWSFTPDLTLAPGVYDLAVEIADKLGNVAHDITSNEIAVPEPPVLTPPAVTPLITNQPSPVIQGTWPSAVASNLTVKLGGTAYGLGSSPELTATAGEWSLKLPSPMADGNYPVTAEVSDKFGRTASAAAPAEIVIDTKPPAAPATASFNGELPLKLSGTWPEDDAVSLVMSLANRVWTLGKDAGLASDGKGNWSFTPAIQLPPGTYDLGIAVTDRAGNVTRDTTKDEIVIEAPPPPPPPPPAMEAPAVTSASESAARPAISGSWSEMAAKSLSVSIGGSTYVLGKDAELSSDGGGHWTLRVPVPLADGAYDVSVTSTDASGKSLSDSTRDEIVIDADWPAAPTVRLVAGESSPGQIAGTWDSRNAASLHVAIPAAQIDAVPGGGSPLSVSDGNWTLNLAAPLPPGSYDVVVESRDAKGRIARDQTRNEILVKEPPPPPPPLMKAPTVTAISADDSPGAITGTWDEGAAKALFVSIADTGIRAALGSDAALTSDGKGNWTLSIAAKLAPGVYDVVAETADAAGNRISDASTAEIYIKAPPPPPPPPAPPPAPAPAVPPPLPMTAPTVTAIHVEGPPSAITGTWDEGKARDLFVSIIGTDIRAALGSDPALTSDGRGNWRLALSEKLGEGVYDVAVETADAAGNRISDASSGEITVVAPPPPPPAAPPAQAQAPSQPSAPPPAPPKRDCMAELAAITDKGHIRFAFNHWGLNPEASGIVSEVAKLLVDEQCRGWKLEVTGHADYLGMRLYNKALSLQRAEVVVAALVAAGVQPERLTAKGLGETSPEIDERTSAARAVNRRVILTLNE